MEMYFPRNDGRWSSKTKKAIKFHNADGLDLNENWAMVRKDWTCPVCSRSKQQIFRLSKKNILLGKLELHHDHMTDHIIPYVVSRFGPDWRNGFPVGFEKVLDSIERLTRRFDFCLICSECNAADGKVKRKFRNKIDHRFSFTPSEIAGFVFPQAHRDHDVDYEKAFELWHAASEGFSTRLQLIENLVTELSDGHLLQDKFGYGGGQTIWNFKRPSELLTQEFFQDAAGTEKTYLLSNFSSEFLARSTSRDSATLRVENKQSNIEAPTDEEFGTYVDPVSSKRWHQTPNDWLCPCCNRSKREILRKSRKGKWAGGIRDIYENIEENDDKTIENRLLLFPNYRNERWVSGVRVTSVCSDCSQVGTHIAQSDRNFTNPYLTIQDIQDCFKKVSPHKRHDIDSDLAKTRILQNAAFASAHSAFQSFQSLVSSFQYNAEHWHNFYSTRNEMISKLCEHLHIHHNIMDRSLQLELVEWVLQINLRSNEKSLT